MTNDPTPIDSGQKTTEGFGERSLAKVAETSSIALAEQAKASVQARYIMALQRPRDLQVSRQRLLGDCKRPKFADAAIYRLEVGEGFEGPSIRMMEAAARALGNILAETTAVYDDAQKRIVKVSATDLECNLTYPKDVTIEKTIERSRALPGRKILGVRQNSKGRDTFLLEATSDEVLGKENALCSKALRECIKRLVPADLLEEALDQCYRTLNGDISADPVAARKKMVDAFDSIGITAQQIADYLGHAVDAATPDEIAKARRVFNALKDGDTTWSEVMDSKKQQPAAEGEAAPAAMSLNEKLAGKAAKTNGGVKTEMKPAPAAPARTVTVEGQSQPAGQSRFDEGS